jgi:tRNA A37 methylthiotransferase MiaB
MLTVAFEQAFMFAFSMRKKTPEHRRYTDDEGKKARLAEVIDILIEDRSRRSDQEWTGRSDRNCKVIAGERALPLPLLHDSLSVAEAQPS